MKKLPLAIIGFITAGNVASAAITFVGADLTNTLVGGAAGVVGTNLANVRSGTDDLWGYTNENASTGTTNPIFSGRDSLDETLPALTTTVTGLAAGEYTTYAFFRDPSVWEHNASASGTVSGPTVTSSGQVANGPGVDATTLSYNGSGPTSGNITSYGVELGTVEVGADGEITWTINQGVGDRTWFEGVGFEAVPEPSSALLSILGAVALLGKRRR